VNPRAGRGTGHSFKNRLGAKIHGAKLGANDYGAKSTTTDSAPSHVLYLGAK